MQRITPFLWFDNQAEEAVSFYTSVFENSRIVTVNRYGEAGPGPNGSVMTIAFELEGQQFTALNGGPVYAFNPAISFVVNCEDQEQVDYYWDRLLQGGSTMQCGWLTDQFGVSWQIVPTRLLELLADPDPERAKRVTEAMLAMIKLDIAELEAAARGE
jgi:predicted 3-demethylubiquinone-9 3-methyltransferase (glyoxalase superfamily)